MTPQHFYMNIQNSEKSRSHKPLLSHVALKFSIIFSILIKTGQEHVFLSPDIYTLFIGLFII
jgi:hypothetical protein